MNEIILVDPEKCVGCNACVRNCPAPEANITKKIDNTHFITTVNPEKCITCGECVRTCEHGARDYIDDTKTFMDNCSAKKMIVLVTPAIKSIFPNTWKSILDYFKKKGHLVYDVSLGADICTWAHLRAIENHEVGNIITQPCAAIVKYIEMYKPKLLDNLVPIHSPISCAAIYIKKYLHRDEPIAVLSPCIAKKQEFNETKLVNYNVTFKKLKEWFEANNIHLATHSIQDFEYEFSDRQGQVGSIYPRPGGLRDNIWLHNPDINITTSEGVHKVYPELNMYAEMPDFKHPEVFDVLSCEFGCNVGPASGTDKSIFDVMATMREVEKASKKKRKQSGLFGKGEDKLFKKFDEELNLNDFKRTYMTYPSSKPPTDEDLEHVYALMGKHTPEQRRYNCHACGYKSCKDMATAIFRGLNTADNCIVHAKSILLARHSELSKQHENLQEITNRCAELSNKLAENIGSINSSMESIGIASNNSADRAKNVDELLSNIIEYCSSNKTMSEIDIKQLIEILNTTKAAFSSLHLNITSTKSNSLSIDDAIKDISKLIDEMNGTLEEISS